MNNLKPLVIVGASGFGRETAALVLEINKVKPTWELLGLVDDKLKGQTVEGFKILGPIDILETMKPKPYVVVAIGDPKVRRTLVERCGEWGLEFATLVHPSVAIVGETVEIGEGSIVCRNTVCAINSKIGKHCIVNFGCCIGHDTQLGDYASLMPHVALGGDVEIGVGCYLGINASVINAVSIGAWSVLGAGAVVTKDIPSNVLAVGVPARVVKNV